MESPERKPIASGSSTPSTSANKRAQLRGFRRESTPPRSIKSEHFRDVVGPPQAKRARPPIQHYDERIVIKREEVEEGSPSRRNALLVSTPGSSKRMRREDAGDVKPVLMRSKRTAPAMEEVSDSEGSDLTDIDEVEARRDMLLEVEDESESEGYVDSELEELEYEVLDKKGKGKAKSKANVKAKNVDYSDLPGLTDVLESNLDLILCGFNPGILSAKTGCPYAHASNSFWKCLHQAGFTEKRLRPDQFKELPALCRIGLTNLSDRTTRTAVELSAVEMRERVLPLVEKLLRCRPKMICFVGMDISKVVLDHFKMLPILPTADNPTPAKIKPRAIVVKLGLQPIKLTFPPRANDDEENKSDGGEQQRDTCWFYCVPSTSGLGSTYQAKDKIILFRELKAQIDRMNAGEELHNIPDSMVEYRAEEFLARQALFEAKQTAKKALE